MASTQRPLQSDVSSAIITTGLLDIAALMSCRISSAHERKYVLLSVSAFGKSPEPGTYL